MIETLGYIKLCTRVAAALSLVSVTACTAGGEASVKAEVTREQPAIAPAQELVVRGEIGSVLDRFLSRSVPFGFSGSVLVATGGEVVLHKGYGLADRQGGVPNTPATVFDFGSVTKQLTAAAILQLQDEGKLSTSDSIGLFFPDAPSDKRRITLHQLLTHTAGLPTYSGEDYEPISQREMLRRVWSAPLRSPPGTRYQYSNPGFSVLAAITEMRSGMPWEEYVYTRLLDPAGMHWTGYTRPQWKRDNLAVGYRGDRIFGTPLDSTWLDDGPSWNLRGNGGLLSTVGDFYRWHLALERGVVLSDSARQALCTPQVRIFGSYRYGYGCSIEEFPSGRLSVGHLGGNGYFIARLRRYPDHGTAIVIASNADDRVAVRHVMDRVATILFGAQPPEIPAVAAMRNPSPSLAPFEGTYVLPSGGQFAMRRAWPGLSLEPLDSSAVDLIVAAGERKSLHDSTAHSHEDATSLTPSGRTSRVAGIMPELYAGSFETLRQFAMPEAFERMQAIVATPPGVSSRIIGTMPAWWLLPARPMATIVEITLPSGSRDELHFIWKGDRIAELGYATPQRLIIPVVARSDSVFVGYHIGAEVHVSLRPRFGPDGNLLGLTLRGPCTQPVFARRSGTENDE